MQKTMGAITRNIDRVLLEYSWALIHGSVSSSGSTVPVASSSMATIPSMHLQLPIPGTRAGVRAILNFVRNFLDGLFSAESGWTEPGLFSSAFGRDLPLLADPGPLLLEPLSESNSVCCGFQNQVPGMGQRIPETDDQGLSPQLLNAMTANWVAAWLM